MIAIGKKVVVAPLDWGLGHATRCIPIIRGFQLKGCEVIIASSGDALSLLKIEFPELQFFVLPAYRATYSKHFPLVIKVFFQFPKFLSVLWKEHREIEKIVIGQQIDMVISDSRFGCWTKLVPTVFITNQVNIQMPIFLKWLQQFGNYFNHKQIKRFDYCWVPDVPIEGITGKLSESNKIKIRFIGILSRFRWSGIHAKKYDVLALISGPEPQRTVFENLVRKQLCIVPGRKLMLRGLPQRIGGNRANGEIEERNHLQAEKLNQIIESSEYIVCRSGFSSISDLAVLNKRVVFVPTPGQTEQEYFAEELEKRGISFYQKQKDFNLVEAIEKSKKYTGFVGWNSDPNLLANAIDDLLLHHL